MKRTHILQRAIALLTALLLLFCLVFSFTFLGINADLCSELTHTLGCAAPSEEEERPAAPSYPIERRTERRAAKRAAATPVSLKVKLID